MVVQAREKFFLYDCGNMMHMGHMFFTFIQDCEEYIVPSTRLEALARSGKKRGRKK